jgi:hypothetical protein
VSSYTNSAWDLEILTLIGCYSYSSVSGLLMSVLLVTSLISKLTVSVPGSYTYVNYNQVGYLISIDLHDYDYFIVALGVDASGRTCLVAFHDVALSDNIGLSDFRQAKESYY